MARRRLRLVVWCRYDVRALYRYEVGAVKKFTAIQHQSLLAKRVLENSSREFNPVFKRRNLHVIGRHNNRVNG